MMDVGASFGKMRSPNPAQGGGDFSNWMQRHRELNPNPQGIIEPKSSPYGMMQTPGLQPSMPQNPGMMNRNSNANLVNRNDFNRGMRMSQNPMMNQMNQNMNPQLMMLLQLIGASNPSMMFNRR